MLGDAAAARAYAAALAAVAGGVDDGAARRYCVPQAEDVLVAAGAALLECARYGEEAKMGLVLGSGQGEDDSVARSAISSGIGST